MLAQSIRICHFCLKTKKNHLRQKVVVEDAKHGEKNLQSLGTTLSRH